MKRVFFIIIIILFTAPDKRLTLCKTARPAKQARIELRKDMAVFVSKFSALPFSPAERKVFDNPAQCEHLLFDPSIKQAFLLPLYHFLQKTRLRIFLPLGSLEQSAKFPAGVFSAFSLDCPPAHAEAPSYVSYAASSKNAYKYWVICKEGLDAIEAMRKQKNENGEPLYSEGDLQRLTDRYGKTWWKVSKQEFEALQKALISTESSAAAAVAADCNGGGGVVIDIFAELRCIHKKTIEDKFTKEEIVMLTPDCVLSPVIRG